ncbi:MAG: CcmD family protein [Bdellovibrionota bacterium]
MEQIPNTFPSLFAGYAVIWTLIVLYVLNLAKRLRAVEKKVDNN